MTTRWVVKWHIGILWNNCKPLLFFKRNEALLWIKKNYGDIRYRKDLRQPPHNWRMPKAVKVEVILKEVGGKP